MKNLKSIGNPPWNYEDIHAETKTFAKIYAQRPIKDNTGGMKSPHMFSVWFIAKYLNPDLIVESGIYKGQSTWLLEQACPNADIVSIDVNLAIRQYISDKAMYSDKDFSENDWSMATDRSLAFFDDHQNAYNRIQQCKWFGLKHLIFEYNYPATQGDCYSLKKAFTECGYDSTYSQVNERADYFTSKTQSKSAQIPDNHSSRLKSYNNAKDILPNNIDAMALQKNIAIYYEFPPVYKTKKTRRGDDWDDAVYPTQEPLYSNEDQQLDKVFIDEADTYTWACYVNLK